MGIGRIIDGLVRWLSRVLALAGIVEPLLMTRHMLFVGFSHAAGVFVRAQSGAGVGRAATPT